MSDAFYNLMWTLGYPALWVSSRPVVIHPQVTRRSGAYILAANHQSPYDIPLIMRHCARNVDYVSIVEVFQNPVTAALYGAMNAFPLDRSKPDSLTVRTILHRLEQGRVVGVFPEGGVRQGATSVLNGGLICAGIGRIAQLAKCPIIPCVIVGSKQYGRFTSWLPLFHTRYGIAFGEPILPGPPPEVIEATLANSLRSLGQKLLEQLPVKAGG